MKTLLKNAILIFSLSLFIISCDDSSEKINTTKTDTKTRLKRLSKQITKNSTTTPSTSNEDLDSICIASFDCFDFVYPISATTGNNTQKVINNDEELDAFYDALPQDDFSVNFVYPLTIKFDDDTKKTLANENELYDAYDSCFGEIIECFTLNFPLTLTNGTEKETTVNNEQELDNFYESLKEDAEPGFKYPITATLTEDKSVVTIANDDEFDALYTKCYGIEDYEDFEEFDCFTAVFPITAIEKSGADLILNSMTDLDNYLYNLPEDGTPAFKFPITINYYDGTATVLNSIEELEEAFENCFYNEEGDEDICFDITYPMNLEKEDKTVTTVKNDSEFDSYLDKLGDEEYFDIAYPITVIFKDKTTKSINNDDEFIALIENCDTE